MNIHELDSYNLGDAVKFNQKLNPRIWGADEKMRPEVREQLLRIADDFREFLGIDVEIQDITVSGSNAAYTYTPHSDIDLHLVVDLPEADRNEVYRELFDAKKYAYNEQHDIRIGGYDVELYVQDANKTHHSQGIYSLTNNDWVSVPKRRRPDVDDISVKSKFEDLGHRIEAAINSGDYEKITDLASKIKDYRQAGLDAHGEFGPENLAFKILRTQGLIKKLYDARNAAKDELLSLDERRKKKKRKSVKYGYGGYWYPGYAYAGQDHPAGSEGGDGGGDGGGESVREDAGMTWDGVNPTTDMFTSEDATMTWDGVNPTTAMFTTETQDSTDEEILRDFIDFCVKELKIENLPRVKLRRDPQWPKVHKTFGRYNDENKTLEVAWGQRHIMDVLRTVAHELTHKHQHEREGERMGPDAGETGSPYENEANARAGVLMRDYGRLHPEYFTVGQAHDLEESASGYIPTRAQAKDPRYSMALTVDVKPGQVGKEANKLKLKTNRQGQPQIARANGLFETLMAEYVQVKEAINAPVAKGKDAEQYYKFIVAKAKMGRPLTRGEQDFVKMYQMYRQQKLAEVSADRLQQYLSRAGQQVDRRQERMSQARERLNKGYEIYDAEDPTKIVHTFDANTPAEARRYYEKFNADYESDRDYDLRLRRATGLMETAQGESEQQHGWRAELVDEISPITFEVRLTNRRSRESANFVVRPADLIRKGLAGKLEIDSMDIQDLQTGTTRSIVTDDPAPWVYILDAVDALFYDTPALQARLQTQLKAYQDKDLPMLPGLKKREHFGQGIAVKDFVQGQQAAKDAVSRAQGRQDIQEDEELDEVKMSPGALEKFATSDAAKGIRAGFEAELIFRDTQGESDEEDPEPDYDADERAYSISQVIEFFDNDEYGYGLSDRERNRLEEQLDETYMNWRDDQMTSDFRNDAEDLIREKLLDETPLSERIHMYLTDSEQMSDKEADRIIAAGVDAPRFNTSKDQAAYAAENPYYQAYLDAADAAELELDESVEYSVSQQDEYWDEALDDYRDNWSGDDDSFFSDVGLRWMSDIANEFGLDWPVWNMGNGGNSGSRDWDEIGAELQQVVGMPVKVSSNYHSTPRKEGQWIIEPDGSLSPDDRSEEAGLEIVSPPMPLLMTLEKLKAVTDWANDPNGGNAYTNSSTGLHMGVSLPRIKSEDANDSVGIDYVKLILFMGDKYVQQQFGREANTYCASALDKLKQNVKGGRSDPAGVVELLRHGLTELAYRELQKGVGTSKYTSAHLQDGYIEFRSPGGDWLAKADEEIGILENTMLRFARAMAIAGNPAAERQEYAKKLYKLVTQDNEQYADQLRLFSEFSAGTINKEQLKKQWADSVLQKEIPGTGKEEYEVYRRDNKDSPDAIVGTLYAKDYDSAYDLFLRQYGRDINELDVRLKQPWFDVQDATGKNILIMRAPDIDKATQRVQYEYGEKSQDWNIYRRPDETPDPKVSARAQVAKRIVKKPATPTQYNYEIVDQRTVDLKVVDRFYANSDQEASRVFDRWLQIKSYPNDTENYGYRQSAQAADAKKDSADLQRTLGIRDVDTDVAQNFAPDYSAYERNSDRIDAIRAQAQQRRQNYELVSDEDPDRVVHRMNNATADEVRAWITQQEAGGMPPGFLRTRIVAESIGQHDDEQTQTALDMAAVDFNFKNWADVEMRGTEQAKTAIRRHAVTKLDLAQSKPFNMLGKSRSAIGKGVDQVDREFIDKQIQTARKLGDDVNENFADGKVKGKSRPGRVKRAGASCAGSVTSLRAKAKKSGGEKGKMYHWCANMKAGRKK
jgi:hypothetical protein